MIIHWVRGNFRIIVANDAMSEREGFVTEDGVWALHLDGEHVTLTHMASGKRVTRFKSLAAADELVRHLSSMDVGWNLRNPNLTCEQELEIQAVIRSYLTRTSSGPHSSLSHSIP